MAEDNKTPQTPKRGAIPTPPEVLEGATPFTPEQLTVPNAPSEQSDVPLAPEKKPKRKENDKEQ